MGFANLLPVVYVDDVHARANNVFEAGARFLERRFDIFEDLYGLRVWVTNADDLAVRVGGSCTSYVYGVAYADSTRVADDGFPGCACGDVLALHVVFFQVWRYAFTALPHPGGRPQGSPLRIMLLVYSGSITRRFGLAHVLL